jgi:hypothetical protein
MALANIPACVIESTCGPRIPFGGSKRCVMHPRAHGRAASALRVRDSAPPVSSKCRCVPIGRPLLASAERMAASSDRSRESSASRDAS